MLMRKASLVVLLVIVSLLTAVGCRDEDVARPDINRPPETILSVSPRQGEGVFHKYLVRWTGLDRDGVVTSYKLAAVTEDEIYGGRTSEEDIAEYLLSLPWFVTDITESLFVLRADRPNSRNHSLYVIAIDNEGKEDPTPALTNFVAIDYELPWIDVFISDNINTEPRVPAAKGDTLPAYNLANPSEPISIILGWQGDDPDGDVNEWRFRLDSSAERSREPVWDECLVPYEGCMTDPCSCYVGAETLTYDPNDPANSDVWIGFHEFRISAIDDANARSPQEIASFVINYDPETMIDSVWSFRSTRDYNGNPYSEPLDTILIYAREWDENPDSAAKYADGRMGYHFGQLIMKFHGWDKDGPIDGTPPSEFKWSIKGTLLKSDWVSNPCGTEDTIGYFCDMSEVGPPFLDSDRPFTLIVSSRDDHQKADGSPAQLPFEVNFTPEIVSVTHTVNDPEAIDVTFSWECSDVDEGYGWGTSQGQLEQALMKYRFRYRLQGTTQWGQWHSPIGKTRDKRYKTFLMVEDMEAGAYELDFRVYNGDYVGTRESSYIYEFTIP